MDIATRITQTTRFQRLTHVHSCDSTQDLAQHDPEPGWAIYWADHQERGRGREGRSWNDSPADDIAVTFRVTGVKTDSPTHLAAAIPVAALRSIADLGVAARIKWPNDILVGGRKLSGILIDTDSQSGALLIGVGMNINRSEFPADLRTTGTSLALLTGRTFDRAERVLRLAQAIDAVLGAVDRGELTELTAAFSSGLGLVGHPVTASLGDTTHTGQLIDLTLDHAVLETATGRQELPLAHLRRLAAL